MIGEPDVVGILETLPSSNMKPDDEDIVLDGEKKYRTISIFSNTMPPVEQIARKYLRNLVVVTIDYLDSPEYRDKLRAMDPLNLMR
ncbi:hypothetical protein Nepgr_026103 [Nepenthes gracilis]|uniref:Uncharacterized protein n=1 Tax=Nepenthes gracilis TaxID=150966 RepID=A0AAD3T6B6_NEPGR|nr:hypothetical protein Nepgr_026103 [Nepenthes gracilis]